MLAKVFPVFVKKFFGYDSISENTSKKELTVTENFAKIFSVITVSATSSDLK